MLPFLPHPYLDELFYSICARYHLRSGHTTIGHSLQDLFGCRHATVAIDLPTNIRSVTNKLSPGSLNTLDHLIESNTLMPYYRAFLPKRRAGAILQLMSGKAKSGNVHMTVGTTASRIPSLTKLRYCPSCFFEDELTVGEPYWHRSHQLPGIYLCHTHRGRLLDSTVPASGIGCKNNLVPLSHSVFANRDAPIAPSVEIEHHVWLATTAHRLLNPPCALPTLNPAGLRQRYLSHLHQLGLATASGRLHTKKISERFLKFYGDDFLNNLHCGFAVDNPNNWLLALIHHLERVKSPLQHLLLIRFIGTEIEDFLLSTPQTNRPFGRGPWPCLNPVASHHRKGVISKCLVSRRPETGIVGTFSCECGFSYERTGPDRSRDDRYRIGRMVTFGSVWEGKLMHLRREERKGLRETARILEVDPNTVQRYQKILTTDPENQNFGKTPIDEVSKILRRECWLKLCANHPCSGVNNLRKQDSATYKWLYRYDKEWLQTHRPQHKHRVATTSKVDWNNRDDFIASRIPAIAEKIKIKVGRPVRITANAIGKELGSNALFNKKMAQLPRTKEVIEALVESREDFAIRRLRVAAKAMSERGEPIRSWSLARVVGLLTSCSPRIRQEINRLAAGYHSDSNLDIDNRDS